jgi:hypothetical protein
MQENLGTANGTLPIRILLAVIVMDDSATIKQTDKKNK